MNDLAVYLAAEARRLGLESGALEHAPPEAVQTFAQRVLHELAALGLIRGNEELGCWATPRPGGH
ncbi:hypothetical protein [Deinococcus marmoris]|uniref:Uncharacterized protein n=1 Tax=Deinococcus marmoris TaxID=249408 RepID=A0A1U7P1H5_9DEIO|nr:hypothetical protein [Deinococcus marmoris]OLV19022.1 hypothetical protein BOO71_0004090 [Deinococcus marmoris]